ncbi:GTP cyclohydrolase II [Candidatus Sumerlaeota bacterium]|nr:GTP cyclohydrolase II [Candidatus Sumerlaeota bacterium]
MVPDPENTALHRTNFTISVDAKHNATTGISAGDRCEAIRVFVNPNAHPSDLARPGHIFPISARRGGVLVRAGQTEGSVDLVRLAGLQPVGVVCEIQNDDGSMARLPELEEISEKFDCPLVTIEDLIAYRMKTEVLIRKIVTVRIPNLYGDWELTMYEDVVNGETHLAMAMGEIGQEPTLVRVHSQCFTGDTLGSLRCECGPQLESAMEQIGKEGRGVIVYMHQEGRGIGLKNKLLAYALQEKGKDTVEANEALGFKPDLREYGIGAQILADLGLKKLRLMTNNPRKIVGIQSFGLEVVERIPLEVGHHHQNAEYLQTKRRRLGHLLHTPGPPVQPAKQSAQAKQGKEEPAGDAEIKTIGE